MIPWWWWHCKAFLLLEEGLQKLVLTLGHHVDSEEESGTHLATVIQTHCLHTAAHPHTQRPRAPEELQPTSQGQCYESCFTDRTTKTLRGEMPHVGPHGRVEDEARPANPLVPHPFCLCCHPHLSLPAVARFSRATLASSSARSFPF